MFEKVNVCMKEHVFFSFFPKGIFGVPCDVFDLGGKSKNFSIKGKIDFWQLIMWWIIFIKPEGSQLPLNLCCFG